MSSSGGWEKVGSGKAVKKDSASKGGKSSKAEKKTFAERAPKLEEVLPLSQINAYSLEEIQAKPTPAKKESKKAPESPQKPKKKEANGTNGASKKERPKTYEEAAKLLSVAELQGLLAHVKVLYPDNQILWIKDAASYFNTVLNAEEPINLTNPFSNYPLSLLTKEMKRVLTSLYEECQDIGRESAFTNLLANLVHDMAKGQSSIGYMILLQSMSEVYPSLCLNSATRSQELINSYRNRPAVCTALIWALGQGGRKDLAVGLRVWNELISDLLPFKNYSRFVVDYLTGLLKTHDTKVKGGKLQRVLTPEQFLRLFDTVFNASGQSKELQSIIRLNHYPAIKSISIGDCGGDHTLFPEFLRRLSQTVATDATPSGGACKRELLKCLSECLVNNKAAVSHWQQMYTSFVAASAELLKYLNSEWSTVSKALQSDPRFERTFEAFQEHNAKVGTQKEGIQESTAALKSLMGKMKNRCRESCGFRWKFYSFLLFLTATYLISKDIKDHNGFEASNTGLFLKDVGLDGYALSSYNFTVTKFSQGQKWTETNFPVVQEKAKLLGEKLQPYWVLFVKSCKDLSDYAVKTGYLLMDKLNEALPGSREKLVLAWEESKKFLAFAAQQLLHYGTLAVKILIEWLFVAKAAVLEFIGNVSSGKVTMADVTAYAQHVFQWTSDRAVFLYKSVSDQVRIMMK